MKAVVITGSTKGIGLGLAAEFLKAGCKVLISGRNEKLLNIEQKKFQLQYGTERAAAVPCDVTDFSQIRQLWDRAAEVFGTVDIWINNAGMANPSTAFHTLDDRTIRSVVETNLIGTMYGSKVALEGMTAQNHGAIYNFEGYGSNGGIMFGLSVYGTTKRGVRYFTRSLMEEQKNSPVLIGTLSPGMVVTDLLLKDVDSLDARQRQRFFKIVNILGDTVETVTPFLVRRMLENKKHGAEIEWLTKRKAAWRFMSAPFRKRNLLTDMV
jgi:NAD(P)-dependent dehydrogenase (short-subunit alcohol dehydrogenase family)